MPNLDVHSKISKKRTNFNNFKELHKWMDEATESLGQNHRLERHFYTQEYKNFIEKKWGKKAVVEWLFHIALDNLETANKFAVEFYNTPFDKIEVGFEGKEISFCDFRKTHPNSVSSYRIELNKKIKEKLINPQKEVSFSKQELMDVGLSEEEAERLMGTYVSNEEL